MIGHFLFQKSFIQNHSIETNSIDRLSSIFISFSHESKNAHWDGGDGGGGGTQRPMRANIQSVINDNDSLRTKHQFSLFFKNSLKGEGDQRKSVLCTLFRMKNNILNYLNDSPSWQWRFLWLLQQNEKLQKKKNRQYG